MSTIFVCIMFIVNGLCLNSDEVRKALMACRCLLYSAVAILGLTPLVAWGLLRLSLRLGMDEALVAGFIVFNAMPTTLSSGLTLVQQAKGNTALALIITVGTNVIGVFTAPFMLAVLLSTADLRLDPAPLLVKLCITIIAPLLLGKAFRDLVPGMTNCVARCKVYLGLLQQLCVVLIAWMQLSKASDQIKSTPAAELSVVLLTSVMIHGTYLVINWAASCLLRLPPSDAKAVIILSSQKTFPVVSPSRFSAHICAGLGWQLAPRPPGLATQAITVITFLDASFARDVGLMVMPCVCSHFVQL
jgi:sodium/bile acid cotransporter 7